MCKTTCQSAQSLEDVLPHTAYFSLRECPWLSPGVVMLLTQAPSSLAALIYLRHTLIEWAEVMPSPVGTPGNSECMQCSSQ